MGWARFDDAYTDHPKIVTAGPLAELLDMRAILFSARYETDGHIPPAQLSRIGVGIPAVKKKVGALVEVERWHEPGHKCKDCPQITAGWMVHDYLTYNPTRESKEAERAAARERMRKAREAKQEANEAGSSEDVRANKERTADELQECSDNPVPSPPLTPEDQRQDHGAARLDDVDGMPLTPAEGLTFAQTLGRWVIEQGVTLPAKDRKAERYAAVLDCVVGHVPDEHPRRRGVVIAFIADYVADVTGETVDGDTRGHLARLVGEFDARAVMHAAGEAVGWGAGIGAEYAGDSKAFTKYMARILYGERQAS